MALEEGERPRLALDGGEVAFTRASEPREEGLVEIALAELPAALAARAPERIGGVRLRLLQPA